MRRAAYLLALLVVLSPLSATAAATSGPADTDMSAITDADAPDVGDGSARVAHAAEALQASPPDPHTVVRVRLQPNRDAHWTVRFTYQLETENQTAAFRHLRESFEAGESAAGPNVALFRTAAEKASTAAGREMRITGVNRTGTVDGDTGTLTLRFTWTDFLERGPGESLRLGDAFRTPSGDRWITSLEEGQRIVIVTPDGYTVNSTSFQLQLQNNSVIIDGPRSLPEDEDLVVVYHRNDRSDPPWALVGGGLALVALAAAAVLYFRRGRGAASGRGPPVSPGESTDGGVGVDGPDDAAAAGVGAGAEADADADVSDGAADEDAGADADEEVDLSLLSDEERVEHLLEQNGGRMKQANIVKETGWSDAKVSQLLSSMTDEGRVEKLRLGRENLISLPDTEGDGDD